MRLVRGVSRVLGVLVLAVGLVSMHAVAGSHEAHAAGPAPAVEAGSPQASSGHGASLPDSATAASHGLSALGMTTSAPPTIASAADCGGDCPTGGVGLVEVCLMVLTAAALLVRAVRPLHHAWRRRPVRYTLPVLGAIARPVPPPSLSMLCISRT